MKRLIALNLILIGCLLFSGCAGVHNSLRPSSKSSHWNLFNRGTAEKTASKKKKASRPENMVVIWKDAVLEKPGTPSVRGFGARIYFHDADNQAIKVEGELVVFGFDDSGVEGALHSKKPTKKFVFTNEQLQTHFSESNIGASYSIWIPWDKFGPDQKAIALIPIFKTSDGITLNGGSTTNVLPSDKSEKEAENEDKNLIAINGKRTQSGDPNQVAQAGYSAGNSEESGASQAVMNQDVLTNTRIKSSTINLPPSMSSHFSTPNANTQSPSDRSTEPRINHQGPSTYPSTIQSGDRNRTSGNSTSGQAPETNSTPPIQAATSAVIDRTGGTTHATKKSPVFGAPGSFR